MEKTRYRTEIPDEVKRFIEEFVNRYDLTEMDYIRFGKSQTDKCSGRCFYPISTRKANKWKHRGLKKREKFHITCTIPNEVSRISLELEDECFRYVGEWQELKAGERYPKPVEGSVINPNIKTRDELIIILLGHEMYHFLRKTKQVEGRNTQNKANKFGIDILNEWRQRCQ